MGLSKEPHYGDEQMGWQVLHERTTASLELINMRQDNIIYNMLAHLSVKHISILLLKESWLHAYFLFSDSINLGII